MKFLISKGADVNAKGTEGSTALHRVIFSADSDAKLVEILIDAGADPNAVDDFGRTPLFNANHDAVKLMVSHGAKVNIKDNWGRTPLHETDDVRSAALLLSKGADVNAKDKSGATPLMFAPYFGSIELIKLFLSKGADINAKAGSGTGYTVLDIAEYVGSSKVIQFLKKLGAHKAS